jgi:hypothetical protein
MYRSTPLYVSALVGGEWSASRPCRFTPGERAPGTHFIGGWVDPRAGLDDMEKWTPAPLVVQPAASRYTDWAIPAPPTGYLTYWVITWQDLPPHIHSDPPSNVYAGC